MTAGNGKIDQLLIRPVLTAQREHALHHSNAKALKEPHRLTWQGAKQIDHEGAAYLFSSRHTLTASWSRSPEEPQLIRYGRWM